ncbi:MFS transporter [Epidermidibacterium keratini]
MRTVVAMLSLCGMMVSLQQTMLIPALSELHDVLGVSPDDVSWIVTVTLLTSAVAMPILSRLADMFGKRRLLLLSLVLVTIGSIIGALGDSLPVILVARALQGMSFSLVPIGISVMRDLLPKERIGAAVALMSATLGIGGSVGLPFGGFIYSHFGINMVFVVSALAGLIMLVVMALVLSESTIRTPGRIDYVGSVLLSGALLCLLLPISKGATWGWTSPLTLGLFAGSAVLFAIWVPFELRVTSPLVDLRTSARKPVLLTNIATVLIGFSMFGQLLGVTQVLTLPAETGVGFGFSPMAAGLFLLPGGLIMVALAPVTAGISNRYGAKTSLVCGGLLIMSGYVVLASGVHTLPTLMVGSCITNAGVALAYAAMPTLIMRAVPITETASANGLNALLRSIGTSTSSAVVAMVLTSDVIDFGGADVPSQHAFMMVFVLSGAGALVGTAIATALPKHRAELSDEEAFTEQVDPGAEFDTPEVSAEREEIADELAHGERVHHHHPARCGR